MNINEIILKLSKADESRTNFRELIIVLARIAACSPHSADVERCISANNRLKTKLRSNLNVETEIKYMYIHHNMPILADWKPTAAAKLFVDARSRRQRETITSTVKTTQQPYFKGIFAGASQKDDEYGDETGDD